MMQSEDKISVIVPCYNVAPYLSQCLESLILQTYSQLEIICVDDGSTDQTPGILEEYSLKDNRIRTITQPNAGISAARNAGLKNASGNYIAFVDADDWLDMDTFSSVLSQKSADIICFSYYRNFDLAEIPKDLGIEGLFTAREVQLRMVGLRGDELRDITSFDALVTCWGKLYKRSIVQGIEFQELNEFGTWEDGLFNLEVLERAEMVNIINVPYYHYRKVAQATYTSTYKENLYLKWREKFRWISKFLKENHKSGDFYVALDNRISVTILNLAFNEMNSGKPFAEKTEIIKKILQQPEYIKALDNLELKFIPKIWKPFYFFVKKRNAFMITVFAGIIHRLANRKSKK